MSVPVATSVGLPPWLERVRGLAWIVGGAGLMLSLILMFVPWMRAAIFPAYLVGYVFWYGIALGSVSLTMLHHLTGGTWGLLIRRPLEAASLAIIPLALLFLPLLLGLDVLYPWSRVDEALSNPFIRHKLGYFGSLDGASHPTRLIPTWFLIRTALYFAIWLALALILNNLSRRQDRTADRGPSRWLARISGPGLGVVFLTGTFAAIDWLMSLEPDWYSSIYGAMLITGWGLATFAAMVLVSGALRDVMPVARVARPGRFNDLGNLMLAFVMLWAYTSFMQYLIIWSGNLGEEIPWYLRRTRGGWEVFAVALIVLQFFAPFFFLLLRDVKRRAESLMALAAGVLVLRLIDTIWLVFPALVRDPLRERVGVPPVGLLLVLLTTAGIGGICVATALSALRTAPLVPVNDPAVDGLIHDDEHEHASESGHAPVRVGG
jgi:hypothetical protein